MRRFPTRFRGFSLLEVVISTFLVGVLLIAALRTVGSSATASLSNADSRLGLALAQDLMSEIIGAEYAEPDEAPLFGPEASDTFFNMIKPVVVQWDTLHL